MDVARVEPVDAIDLRQVWELLGGGGGVGKLYKMSHAKLWPI